jgi:hypothetical protein|tara:strand:- start:11680 stop:11883 length:204 start_codon:yes stop_codon:yes gene_type:complete
MIVSECCSAPFYEPGWPDNDICSECREHADGIEDEEEEPKRRIEIEITYEGEEKDPPNINPITLGDL